MSTEEAIKAPEGDEAIEVPIGTSPSSGMVNDLVPPPGTMYYGQRTYNFLNNHEMGVSRKFGRVTWNAEVYTYATGAVAPTDPNFASKGGTIYSVFVHSGFVRIYDNFSADVWNRMIFEIYLSESKLTPTLQLPYTGSETVSGDNYNYSIDYGQAMQMLKNQGNEAFLFNAKYQQSFSRVKAKQTSSTAGVIQFGINTTSGSSDHRTIELYGLSVLTHKNPSQFPVVPGFKFDINGNEHWAISGGFYLHLGF